MRSADSNKTDMPKTSDILSEGRAREVMKSFNPQIFSELNFCVTVNISWVFFPSSETAW